MFNLQQEDLSRKRIIDQRPVQLKLNFCLWSRRTVMLLIEQQYGITLLVRIVGKYLTRWGLVAVGKTGPPHLSV